MEKKRITLYKSLNEPHEAQIREYAGMTPEERWGVYQRFRRRHYALLGRAPKRISRITLERPSWI